MRKGCTLGLLFALGASVAGITPAAAQSFAAQPPSAAILLAAGEGEEELLCPASPLSVYFAPHEVMASDQARALIGKLQSTARDCQPDEVRLLAIVDADLEGDRAEQQARERLTMLSDQLVAAGVEAHRIVTGMRPGKSTRSPDSQINAVEILLWRHAEREAPQAPNADTSVVALHAAL